MQHRADDLEVEMTGSAEATMPDPNEATDFETYPVSEAEAVTDQMSGSDRMAPNPKAGKKLVCGVTGKEVAKKKAIPLYALRPSLAERIREDHPDLPSNAPISLEAVGDYRSRLVAELMRSERGELSELDRQVAESLNDHETIAENIEDDFNEDRTLGETLSDHLASFGGSWAFLISFGCLLAVWISINLISGDQHAFDPYPFILLNLCLSCIAAVQAPIIMMSQKRQEEKDRLRSLNDYKINLKAELEIRHLHEKIDYLLSRQWQRLAEIQQLQFEGIQDVRQAKRKVVQSRAGKSGATQAAATPRTGDLDLRPEDAALTTFSRP